ncbi:hypothetical protein TNCV_3199831 [Trichonephila clavipes]|nr:hypothetical protein TNCV_3199831 [Trichonephila clavipes]
MLVSPLRVSYPDPQVEKRNDIKKSSGRSSVLEEAMDRAMQSFVRSLRDLLPVSLESARKQYGKFYKTN